jgi:hypothetical protein
MYGIVLVYYTNIIRAARSTEHKKRKKSMLFSEIKTTLNNDSTDYRQKRRADISENDSLRVFVFHVRAVCIL